MIQSHDEGISRLIQRKDLTDNHTLVFERHSWYGQSGEILQVQPGLRTVVIESTKLLFSELTG